MCKCLEKTLGDFKQPKFGRRQDCSLAHKIAYITSYVTESRGLAIRELDLSFKVFRDLLIHPYVRKSLRQGREPKRELSQADIFDLTLDEMQQACSMVDQWLGDVTRLFEYPRGYDTERLAKDYAPGLVEKYANLSGSIKPGTIIDFWVYRV